MLDLILIRGKQNSELFLIKVTLGCVDFICMTRFSKYIIFQNIGIRYVPVCDMLCTWPNFFK